jgi:hypothetical protein
MDEEFEGRVPARKFQRIDIPMLGLSMVADFFQSMSNTLESVAMLLAAHANYNVEQNEFHRDATMEIENLTGEQDA